MTDRSLPVDGAPACPFVAFEDDRDARSTAPDHRHRCFAEPRPAPRALAHQEAYCLSSAFAVCPTFQDWARREAAAARTPAVAPVPPPRTETEPGIERSTLPPPEREPRHAPGADGPPPLPPHRPAPRDWAAPPPWLADDTGRDRRPAADRGADADAPRFLSGRDEREIPPEARGLAGSAADRWASSSPGARPASIAGARPADEPARRPEPERQEDAAPVDEDAWAAAAAPAEPRRLERRERVPAERPDYTPPPPSRPRTAERRRDETSVHGPSWEQPRRAEAYPTLKTRVALPSLPGSTVLVGILALVLAAAALFFLPALLGVGGDDPVASPTPSQVAASATPEPSPTPEPEPTPTVHVVAQGDTLSKIANQYGVTLDQLLAANPQITNPNRIAVGDQITIPAAEPSIPSEVGGEATPAP